MKKLTLLAILVLSSFSIYGQEVITDKNFKAKVKGNRAFEDRTGIVVVEFWAPFNDKNSFKDWDKLNGVEYYRCDISKSPEARSKYGVKTLPYIIIYKEGYEEYQIKAGIDYKIKMSAGEIQEKINELDTESKF